MSRRSSHAQK